MPTKGRSAQASLAIQSFLRQGLTDSELIVYDTSGYQSLKAPTAGGRIRYYLHGGPRLSIGALRNVCCDLAQGEFIAHFDDDDWSHAWRLEEQLQLIRRSGREVAGYHSIYFLDRRQPAAPRLFRYRGPEGYALGSSLLYRRSLWQRRPFLEVDLGEDSKFLDGIGADGRRYAEPLLAETVDGAEPFPRLVQSVHPRSSAVPTLNRIIRAVAAGERPEADPF